MKKRLFESVMAFLGMLVIVALIHISIMLEEQKKQPIEFIQGGDISKAETIDSLTKVVDSLYAELQFCEKEMNRHQTAFNIFLKKNPAAAKELATIISQETK